MLSVWRLKSTNERKENTVTELVHHKQMGPSLPFVPMNLFVSEKYLVTILGKFLHNENEKLELVIEVRSTANPDTVVYSINMRVVIFFFFGFLNDIFAIHICLPGDRKFIRYR